MAKKKGTTGHAWVPGQAEKFRATMAAKRAAAAGETSIPLENIPDKRRAAKKAAKVAATNTDVRAQLALETVRLVQSIMGGKK